MPLLIRLLCRKSPKKMKRNYVQSGIAILLIACCLISCSSGPPLMVFPSDLTNEKFDGELITITARVQTPTSVSDESQMEFSLYDPHRSSDGHIVDDAISLEELIAFCYIDKGTSKNEMKMLPDNYSNIDLEITDNSGMKIHDNDIAEVTGKISIENGILPKLYVTKIVKK